MKKITAIKYVFALLLLFAGNVLAQLPDLERIEPMFWWVGMKNPKLQLIVHGNNIAGREVKLSHPGVRLAAVHKVENKNYLFIDLDISPAAKPGKFIISFVKYGANNLTYSYELKKRNTATNVNQGVTDKDLIYLIMPDRFSNGDPTNDRVPGMEDMSLSRDSLYTRHGGDIQGVMNHLDYLKDLGVTAIWLTPEVENNEPHASYHGYAVTDHYKIDPRFGTNELYKAYVEKCHSMGLKVIKDLVHNHCGSEHWFIKDMPMHDWVHEWPQYTNSNFRDMTVMDPHGSAIDKKTMLDGWFDHHMPDMNESNPYVANYLTQNSIWWIEYAGIDGLRLDTYPYNDAAYMAQWAQDVKAEFPSLSIFGETLVNSVLEQAYFTQGNTVSRGFDTHLPGITDVQIKDAIYEAINGKDGWIDGVNRLYTTLAADFVYQDATRNVIFMDNHDMSRFYSMVKKDFNKFKIGMAMLLTMRGIPQIYYGTEILMDGYSDPDGLVRKDFEGGWATDSVNKFTKAGRTENENEAFDYVKKLANYRKDNPVLQTGKLMQYLPKDGVYAYFRYNNSKTVMVVFNSTDKEKTIKKDQFAERTDGFTNAVNIISGELIPSITTLQIPAKTIYVLELGK